MVLGEVSSRPDDMRERNIMPVRSTESGAGAPLVLSRAYKFFFP